MHADLQQPSGNTWRALYLEALFEADPIKMPERTAEAEQALYLRERQLWYSDGAHTKEKLALTGAMRALEVLRTIHGYPPGDPAPGQARSGIPRRSE
jgi:hypothetical protein